MEYLNTIEPITMEQFLPMVIQFKMDGWRLVQICACRLPEQYELSYSFAKGFDMRTLRLTVGEDEPVSSITQVYPCAFIQETKWQSCLASRLRAWKTIIITSCTALPGTRHLKKRGEGLWQKEVSFPLDLSILFCRSLYIWISSWKMRRS